MFVRVNVCCLGIAESLPSALSSVSIVPVSSRPGYDPAVETKRDCMCVLSVGPTFQYVIPSFDILQVDTADKSEGIHRRRRREAVRHLHSKRFVFVPCVSRLDVGQGFDVCGG